jgi:glycosyltransferase involved in cell wall biosynthesis
MQLPCIVSDINGCNEIITSYVNGWIIPPKDSVALEQAMLLSMLCPNIKRMGLNARAIVQDKFERHQHWQNMLQFYNSKLANS